MIIMTKEEIELTVKRYPFIIRAVKKDLKQAVFYVGNRKQKIEITENIKIICYIAELVEAEEPDEWIKFMIKGILAGESDVWIMQRTPFSKNAYYARKTALIEKVYECCICYNLVSLKEILKEKIA